MGADVASAAVDAAFGRGAGRAPNGAPASDARALGERAQPPATSAGGNLLLRALLVSLRPLQRLLLSPACSSAALKFEFSSLLGCSACAAALFVAPVGVVVVAFGVVLDVVVVVVAVAVAVAGGAAAN